MHIECTIFRMFLLPYRNKFLSSPISSVNLIEECAGFLDWIYISCTLCQKSINGLKNCLSLPCSKPSIYVPNCVSSSFLDHGKRASSTSSATSGSIEWIVPHPGWPCSNSRRWLTWDKKLCELLNGQETCWPDDSTLSRHSAISTFCIDQIEVVYLMSYGERSYAKCFSAIANYFDYYSCVLLSLVHKAHSMHFHALCLSIS